jgi:hypothetical protein
MNWSDGGLLADRQRPGALIVHLGLVALAVVQSRGLLLVECKSAPLAALEARRHGRQEPPAVAATVSR